ncbi:MAG: DUF4258 domain-containing protein [Dehalococcoidia bacterium]|nr:DUF4258 domain-containing protein [Dehalococcoidia bacterium]
MKPILFSQHALDQMPDRGANREEVEAAIRTGELAPAKSKRLSYRKNFPFNKDWKGRKYAIKQVMPIVIEESDRIIVVTVYVFYFGGTE